MIKQVPACIIFIQICWYSWEFC